MRIINQVIIAQILLCCLFCQLICQFINEKLNVNALEVEQIFWRFGGDYCTTEQSSDCQTVLTKHVCSPVKESFINN